MAVKLNYYEILGVSSDSDICTIKSAYRKLARKYHPDLNKNNIESAMKHFKMVSDAYETLSDVKKRYQYDLINGIFKTKFNSDFNFNANFEKPKQEYKSSFEKSTDEKTSKKTQFKETIDEIFDEFSKKSKSKFEKEKLEPIINGTDVNVDLTIALSDVVKGCKRTINVLHTQSCPKCHGRKFINGSKCKYCDGNGEISEHKKITVTIPAGIKNNTKLRLRNEGNAGINGGLNGDLFVLVSIKPSARITYERSDIIYKLPVAPYEAVLGADINVPTFDGNILLKLPKNTCNGQKFRLSNLGLNKNGKIGDMIVIVDIEISSSLSDDEIRLYEKLKKLDNKNLRENILYE